MLICLTFRHVDRYHQASVIFCKAFGKGHIVQADILGEHVVFFRNSVYKFTHLTIVLLQKCDYNGAKAQFCTALDIYNSKLLEGHSKIVAASQH